MKFKFSLFGLLMAALVICTGLRAEAATDWNTQKITVVGSGIPAYGMSGAQARLMAQRAATADAYRQLAEIVQGVQVDADTTVEMAMVKSDSVRLKVSALVKGAKIISRTFTNDGVCEVTMELPMFGATGGLAEAVLERPTYVEPFPEPQTQRIDISTSVKISVKGGYTGVIIDCRGFHLQPVMSPVIKNSRGEKIYGHKNLDYDKVIEYGMASYADSMNQAYRAGSNPLVIKAVDVEDFNSNPVVSMSDAELILSENQISGFLEDTAVVFLY